MNEIKLIKKMFKLILHVLLVHTVGYKLLSSFMGVYQPYQHHQKVQLIKN